MVSDVVNWLCRLGGRGLFSFTPVNHSDMFVGVWELVRYRSGRIMLSTVCVFLRPMMLQEQQLKQVQSMASGDSEGALSGAWCRTDGGQ